MVERKTSLTPEEKIEVAYWNIVRGFNQHDIAAMKGLNAGRVAEACSLIKTAVGLKKEKED